MSKFKEQGPHQAARSQRRAAKRREREALVSDKTYSVDGGVWDAKAAELIQSGSDQIRQNGRGAWVFVNEEPTPHWNKLEDLQAMKFWNEDVLKVISNHPINDEVSEEGLPVNSVVVLFFNFQKTPPTTVAVLLKEEKWAHHVQEEWMDKPELREEWSFSRKWLQGHVEVSTIPNTVTFPIWMGTTSELVDAFQEE